MRFPFPIRALLWFDAATCLAMAALLLVAGSRLAPLLGLPEGLLAGAAIILLPFLLLIGWTAARNGSAGSVRFIPIANFLWVAASLLVVAGPWFHPTRMGTAFILVQAAAVALLALLQRAALTRQAAA